MDFIFPATAEERGGALANIIRVAHDLPIGKAWRFTIVEWKATRSQQQNRYLNGVAYKLLMDATGYSRNDIAELMCGEYFGWKTERCPKTPHNPSGVKDVPIRTTTTNEMSERDVLSREEFAEYVAFVQAFGAHHGILIPDPDPSYRQKRPSPRAPAASQP